VTQNPIPGDPELVAQAQNGLPGRVQIRHTGQPAPPTDPLEQYLQSRRARMAESLREQELKEFEAQAELDRRKKEAEILKVETEVQELKQKLRAAQPEEPDQRNSLVGALIATLNQDKNRAYEEAREYREAMQQQLLQTVEGFRQDARQKATDPGNGSPASDLTSRIAELKAIREVMADLFPSRSEVPVSSTIDETIRLYQLREQHEARMAELTLLRDERLRRLDMEEKAQNTRLSLEQEKMENDRRRNEILGNTLEKAAPPIVDMLSRSMGGAPSAPTISAPAQEIAPQVRAAMTVEPQGAGELDGTEYIVIDCPGCGLKYRMVAGAQMAQCPSCQQLVRIQPGE
jgi:hypothetical protein